MEDKCPKKNSTKDIKPGDFFEDCNYHPCLCVKTYSGMVDGISLIDGSYPRNCGVPQCLIRKLTLKEALQWKLHGPQNIDDPIAVGLIKNKWWPITPMNQIEKKDKSIKDAVKKLCRLLGDGAFDVVDYWDSDCCAIGIAKPSNHDVLVFIQTFGNKKGRYDVHLELPPMDRNKFPYSDAGIYMNITFDQMVKIITAHLKTESAKTLKKMYTEKK